MTRALFLQKLKAAAWHFLLTFWVAGLCGLLIFGVWYPEGLATYVGGVELYQLVLLVELTVGPLMSLIIFNPAKPKGELVRDYCVVGLIQIAALTYGLWTVAQARPVYLVFVKDRIEVVAAVAFDSTDLEQAAPEYSNISWMGPKRVCVQFPEDIEKANDLLFSAAFGKDIQYYPQYYRGCHNGEREKKGMSRESLQQLVDLKAPHLIDELPETDFRWLPVKHRFGAMIEIYPDGDVSQGYYLPLNPFE